MFNTLIQSIVPLLISIQGIGQSCPIPKQPEMKPLQVEFTQDVLPLKIKTQEVQIIVGESNTTIALEKEKQQVNKRKPQTRQLINVNPIQKAVYQDYKVIGYSSEQCLAYFHRVTGRTFGVYYPMNITPSSHIPRIGTAALFTYNHIGLVVGIGDGYVVVNEANYIPHTIIQRIVPLREIRGYI